MRIRRVLCILTLAAMVALLALPASAFAAKGQAYDYTVRVWGGNQGTLNGESKVEFSVAYGDTFSLDKEWVKLGDGSKYYVKGFRLSGQDSLHTESFTVDEDMDFVVAYGVKGDMVSYTLNFVEYGTGRVLADPVTHYGNKGDKPIVAFEYIEGYRPRYRNITGTLGEEGTNSWTFEYIALAPGESEDGTSAREDSSATDSTTAPRGSDANATAPGGADGQAAPTGAAGAAGAGTGAPGEGTSGDEAPPTEEVLDEDNPLASGDGMAGEDSQSAFPVPVAVIFAIAAAVVVVVAAAIAIAVRTRRKRNSE